MCKYKADEDFEKDRVAQNEDLEKMEISKNVMMIRAKI